METEIVLSRDLKKRIIQIIKRSYNGQGHLLTEGDAIILFHWVRHQDDPLYSFVPKRFRTPVMKGRK